MDIEWTTLRVKGGDNLGFDIPVVVYGSLITFGPAKIILLGKHLVLEQHQYEILISTEERVATASLVLDAEQGPRIRVIESLANEVLVEGGLYMKAISAVAIMYIRAGEIEPHKIHKTVVTPGHPLDIVTNNVRPVLRPDLEPDEIERQRKLNPRRAAIRQLRELEKNPVSMSKLDVSTRDKMIDLLAAVHGLVIPE